MDIARRIRQLERGIQLALHRMGMDPTQPEESRRQWALLEAFGEPEYEENFRDIIRLVNELDHLEALSGIQLVRVLDRHGQPGGTAPAALARLEGLGYEVRVERKNGYLAQALYEGRVVAQAYGYSRWEALEGLAGELGVAL